MKKKLFVSGIIVLTIAGISFWVFARSAQSVDWRDRPFVEIRRDDSGFRPSTVRIAPGTEVRFINESSQRFWPASNVHPYHSVYPEFDPRQPIEPGESWTFVFTVEGTWLYHDHLAAMETGVIIVEPPGSASDDIHTRIAKACNGTTALDKRSCWNLRLTEAFSAEGLETAFAEMKKIYEEYPEFGPICHTYGHDLGLLANIRYGDNVPIVAEMGYCNEAFYHGYMQGFVEEHNGDPIAAAAFCDSLREKTDETHMAAAPQCRHGTGHGLMEYHLFMRSDLWTEQRLPELIASAMEDCDRAFVDEDSIFRCASGGFNVLVDWLPLYDEFNAIFSVDDPFHLCNISNRQSTRSACAWEFAKAIRYLTDNPDERLAILLREGRRFDNGVHLQKMMESFAMMMTSQFWGSNEEELIARCHALDVELRNACIAGVSTRLFRYGKPGVELERPIRLCSSATLSESERETCALNLLENVRTSYLRDSGSALVCVQLKDLLPPSACSSDTITI